MALHFQPTFAQPASNACRPKTWWLAQNKFYGLAQAKATPIGTLRSKLENALRSADGMKIPEKILNLEAGGNRKYKELHQIVLQETQPAKRGAAKAIKSIASPTLTTTTPKLPNPKPPKAAASSSSKVNHSSNTPAARKASTKSTVAAGGATVPGNKAPTIQPTAPDKEFLHRKTASGNLHHQIIQGTSAVTESYEDSGEIRLPRTKQTARKTTGGAQPRKRNRSPDNSIGGPSNKRLRAADDGTGFEYLTGTYDIAAPKVSEGWSNMGEEFQLVITLDSERRLFGAFELGIYSGVLRSSVDIEPRADGASAKFEWCGQEEGDSDQVYPPNERMKGVLRFTRRKRDGSHTVKGVIEDVPAMDKCEFTGEKVDEAMAIPRQWEDYNWEAYDIANRGRWGGRWR